MNGPDPAAPGVGDPASPHAAEPVGSVAQEAFKLFRAVTSSAPDDAEHGAERNDGTEHGTEHGCTTTWCPVCQVADFVRDNPDAIASVKRSATDLARSVRALVDTALAPEEKQ